MKWRVALLVVVALIAIGCLSLRRSLHADEPVVYDDLEDHFKYGSTGGERESGIPYWIWKVLPKIVPGVSAGEKL